MLLFFKKKCTFATINYSDKPAMIPFRRGGFKSLFLKDPFFQLISLSRQIFGTVTQCLILRDNVYSKTYLKRPLKNSQSKYLNDK